MEGGGGLMGQDMGMTPEGYLFIVFLLEVLIVVSVSDLNVWNG